jgi:putative membrane protein
VTIIWLAVFSMTLVWSGIDPKDQFTWLLEVAPALIGLALLVWTRKKFPLTPLLYILILIHCLILMVGGHYTYAEVPLFDWLKEPLGCDRNNYDKVGHFAQGFVPAIIAREILIRLNVVAVGAWLNLYILSVCLAFSAFYELIEWWVALASGEDAEAFLGSQGYMWDTQSDMFLALIGTTSAIVLLSHLHDGALHKLLQESR